MTVAMVGDGINDTPGARAGRRRHRHGRRHRRRHGDRRHRAHQERPARRRDRHRAVPRAPCARSARTSSGRSATTRSASRSPPSACCVRSSPARRWRSPASASSRARCCCAASSPSLEPDGRLARPYERTAPMKRALQYRAASRWRVVLLGRSHGATRSPNAPEEGSMGVWGYVAAAKNAQLELAENQHGVDDARGRPRPRPRATPGSSCTLTTTASPASASASQHVDKGEIARREGQARGRHHAEGHRRACTPTAARPASSTSTWMNKEMSPDRPFFVDGKELAKVVTVR